ncbi:uroporphyrinogen-III C-methyltransferase [Tepidamorphus gemmatus]|uniref:uroporphyrinogen-III C-methyltransferase n=1 Tax=Tepidamorphus gemmatus TaxID=747076 RepID=A0A4R3MNE4_9HYPH|nr:uroporphyrinogen-III C-methyltransferase [Tepidamorphus gemmatus]TCT13566.1 uroporphyrinogen-III C-methyltransferase [Tepidamorphus gemmatus]
MKTIDALRRLMGPVPRLVPGHVWLAGAGPGDPAHLTLGAIAGLAQADVIVHDALVDPRVLALKDEAAVLEFAGKRGGRPSATQADISRRLVELARAGRRVLRLKGGDPFVFGRGGEEALTLAREGIPFRIVPGVTSGLAGLALASIPATHRGVNQAVILATGHAADSAGDIDWAAVARTGFPVILYMAMKNLRRIAGALMAGGLAADTPAAIVVSATLPEEQVLVSTLERIAAEADQARLSPPAIVAIGGIVALREQLAGLARTLMEPVP